MNHAPIAVAFREVRHFQPDDCLHCEAIELRGALHDWTIPAHRHEGLHQFQWLRSGAARFDLIGSSSQVAAPAAFLLPPGCVHAFVYAPGSTGLQVTVPSALLARAFASAPALAARLSLPQSITLELRDIGDGSTAGTAEEAAGLFAQLDREFKRSEPGRSEALQAHALLLATWFLRHGAGRSADEGRQALRDTLVQRYRALLALHLRQQHALGHYAQLLNVTPDHLSRACRAVAGLSALDLLHERLVAEARQLLAHTDAAVGEVAHELGFGDAAYFSRFFARRTGQSPQAYRAALQQGQGVPP
jgi:AraC family transcriptional activator of pobA